MTDDALSSAEAATMTDEDLIESAPRPQSAWRRGVERLPRRFAGRAALLVTGLIAGSIAGYVVGQGNPQVLGPIYGYSIAFEQSFEGFPPQGEPFEQTYGRTPPPSLTPEDLAALGENVTRHFSVLSGRSAIPVLCDAGLGQPGTSNNLNLRYPSTVFRVDGGQLTQLVWPRANDAAASGTLQTLALQAQLCPDVPNSQATVVTGGVLTGIGDEYAIFSRRQTASVEPDAVFATVVLVRVGADLIEIAFTSDAAVGPDAEARCLRVAAAAALLAAGG